VYAGAGLIANDRRANALQIYLSKPLTRTEYVFGKCAILMTLLLGVTWLPAILLLLVQIAFSGSLTFFVNNLYLFPAITLFSFIQVLVSAGSMLALSSLSRSSRYVGVLYAGLIFFTQALYGVVFALTADSRMAWMSVVMDLAQIGDAIFRLPLRFAMPVPLAFAMIALLIAGSGFVLRRRVQGIEVVS
jgi:ABC-2 type transport system permease protein